MKLLSYSLIAGLLLLLTACPYQSEYVLGEKTDFDIELAGTYSLDSAKIVAEKLILEIDSNANYQLITQSEENGEQIFTGTLINSSIDNTKILNLKSDDLEEYYYFKYDLKNSSLNLQFLSNDKFEVQDPKSKIEFDSSYTSTSDKNKVWAFKIKLKRE